MTIVYLAGVIAALVQPSLSTTVGGSLLLFSVIGLVLLLVLRWRGFLQTELVRLGRIRGVGLL